MDDRIVQSFDAEPEGKLILELERASVEVKTHEAPSVDITLMRKENAPSPGGTGALQDDVRITTDQRDHEIYMRVEIDRDRLSWWERLGGRFNLKCDVTVPPAYHLDLNTSGGGILVDDLKGAVYCKTSGGGVKLGRIEGHVVAKTSGGGIELEGGNGIVDLKTGGGGIRIGTVEGDVVAKTSGGGIRMDRVTGRASAHTSGGGITIHEAGNTVEAITSGGSITICMNGQPQDHCRLETSGGGINAFLVDDIAVTVDARTSGGQVSSALPVEGEAGKRTLRGDVNGGGPELIMRTSGGGVHIRRHEAKGENDG